MNPYIHTYLDSETVDDLWSQIKQSGVPTEKVKEVQKRIMNNTKIGLGNFVKALFADLNTEIEGEIGSTKTETTILLPSLKLIMLEEILEDVKILETKNYSFSELNKGDFIKISVDKIELFPVPSQEDFMFVNMLSEVLEENTELTIELLEKLKNYTNAMTFSSHLEEGNILEKGGTIYELQKVFENELSNLLQINENDLTLGVSTINYFSENKNLVDVFLTSILKRKFIRKNKATYMINNNVEIFGRVISINKKEKDRFDFKGPESREHFGIECISIRIK